MMIRLNELETMHHYLLRAFNRKKLAVLSFRDYFGINGLLVWNI